MADKLNKTGGLALVEGFRLTPELKKWAQELQNINKVRGILLQGLSYQMNKTKSMGEMLKETDQTRAQLLRLAPKQIVFEEEPGQYRADEEQERGVRP